MALKWALYAEKYGLQHLAATCERFIMLHFMDMAGSPELEQVCLEQVASKIATAAHST